MKLIGAKVLNDNFSFEQLDIEIEDKKIKRVEASMPYTSDEMVIDCSGFLIVPGFVDIHIHGCAGFDACDGTKEAIEGMAKFLVTKGVTSFCPTTMTTDKDTIAGAMSAIKAYAEHPTEGAARAVGINMEGPFISERRKGAQKADYIVKPDIAFFNEMQKTGGNLIKLVDIAPEEDETGFIEQVKESCTVSIAHTNTGYAGAKSAFDKGITHATHLFNAMSGLTHREPGVVGAVFDDSRITAELICDGFHIHPAVLRTAFRLLGDRAVVVSDSMRGNGLPEGDAFDLGGQAVTVKDGKALLSDGTIAGSVTNQHDEIKNLVSYGIPLETAVKAATLIPAKVIGLEHEIGSIAVNKRADLVVLDESLEIAAVYAN